MSQRWVGCECVGGASRVRGGEHAVVFEFWAYCGVPFWERAEWSIFRPCGERNDILPLRKQSLVHYRVRNVFLGLTDSLTRGRRCCTSMNVVATLALSQAHSTRAPDSSAPAL